jgi:lipopolysaccharide biosynthesis glycosyltransferase
MSELHLACAADAAYVPHSAAMLHSAITRGGRPLCIHYLHGPGFSPEDMAKLGEMLTSRASKIVFHEIPDRRLRGLPLDHRFGPAMWYRVFLPELLPDIPRILYLDIDTLVIEPLDQLWDTALDGCYLAAVTNVFMGYHRRHAAELGLELTDYFNSGVVLFNLDLMRARDFAGALIDLVRRRGPQLLWPDQDAFNLTAASSWARLQPRWNVMNSFTSRPRLARETFGPKALTEALAHPAI